MPNRWTDEQRAAALDVYAREGLAAAHHATGVPRGTLRDWAAKAGVAPPAARADDNKATQAATLARVAQLEASRDRRITLLAALGELAIARAIELVRNNDADVSLRDLVGAFTRSNHDLALLTGEATEHQAVAVTFTVPQASPVPPVVVAQDELPAALGP